MRLAYELGFANSCLFTRGHVTFLSLDGIAFARPVPIGSLLRLTSNIVHSSSSELYPALVVRCRVLCSFLSRFSALRHFLARVGLRGRGGPRHWCRAADERLPFHVVQGERPSP